MPVRMLTCAALIFLAALPAPARAADDKAPALVVRVQSIDDLFTNFRYLAAVVGQEEQAKQFEGLIKLMTGKNGLGGFDTKKPLGFYAHIGPNGIDSSAVVVAPVASQKDILDLLQRFNLKVEEGQGGLFTLSVDQIPVPLFFRFANGHVYVTAQDKSAIEPDKLLNPAKVLPADPAGVVSFKLALSQVPENLKKLFVEQMELNLANEKEKRPGETDAQHKVRVEAMMATAAQFVAVVRDGGDLSARLNLDRVKNEVSAELYLTGKPGTDLAKSIAGLGQVNSLFAGLISKDSAANGVFHGTVPASLQKVFNEAFDHEFRQALEKEQDKAKRELAEKVFKALEPTLKAGELDAAVDLRGPAANKLHTLVAGLKVKNGAAIEKVIRDVVKDLPEAERALIKLDTAKLDQLAIHRVDMPKELDPNVRQLFGDNPLFFAVRSDALFVALGENGLDALKQGLAARPGTVPPVRLEISLARLAPALSLEQPGIAKAAQEAFAKDKDGDKIRVVVEGGSALKARIEMKAAVVNFLRLAVEAQQGGQR